MLMAFVVAAVLLGLVSAGLGLRARRLFLRRVAQLDREMSAIRGFMNEELQREGSPIDEPRLN